MTGPAPRPQAEDDLPDLPELDGEVGDPGGEAYDEPLETAGDSEDVGLDDTTGAGDPVDERELGDGLLDETSILAGAEGIADLAIGDEIDDGGELERWTVDAEASEHVEAWDADFGGDDEEARTELNDAGDEGAEEPAAAGGDDDTAALPSLDRQANDEAAGDDVDLADEGEVAGGTFEEEARASAPFGARLGPPYAVTVRWLGPDAEAIVALGGPYVVGERLYRVNDGALAPIDGKGLDGGAPTSVAVHPARPAQLLVGTRLDGVLRSSDGGATFGPGTGGRPELGGLAASVPFYVDVERVGVARFWCRTRSGALYRTEDFAETWSRPLLPSPVAAFTTDLRGGGAAALLVPRSGNAELARTLDGGRGWTVRAVPGLAGPPREGGFGLALAGETVLITDESVDGAWLSADGGVSFERIPALAGALAVAIAEEPEGLVAYAAAFHAGGDHGAVVRVELAGRRPLGVATVLDVRAERAARSVELRGDPEGDHRVYAISAASNDGRTVVVAGTGAGLFEVVIERPSPAQGAPST